MKEESWKEILWQKKLLLKVLNLTTLLLKHLCPFNRSIVQVQKGDIISNFDIRLLIQMKTLSLPLVFIR